MASRLLDDPPRRWRIGASGALHPGCDLLRRTVVRLDGEVQRGVRGWDCEKGELVRLARDRRGRVKLNKGKTAVLEQRLKGTVTVELVATPEEARWLQRDV